jgi:glycosyltransferase involved in cell wall biosynthesis
MKVAVIRGTYTTKFELQNYDPLLKKHNLTAFTGLNPINKDFEIKTKKLFSPVDLPDFPYKMPILNRLCLGDGMYLFGLEKNLAGFDIAHVRETYFHFTQQALNAKNKGLVKAVVSTCSETIPFNHEGISNRKKFKQRAIEHVDYFHCHTQKAKQCLIKEGCNPHKIMVFPYGVDLEKFKPDKKLQKKEKIIKILYVGRLVKEKKVDDLIKAFNKLRLNFNNVSLLIIGKGPELINLRLMVDGFKINNLVKFKTAAYKNIDLEYKKADIFCLISKPTNHWQEYSSRALTEALACGLPVVVSDNGGNRDFANGAGFIVKPGKWKQTYLALSKLVKNQSLRLNLAKKARLQATRRFNNKKAAQNIETLWIKAIKTK